MLGYIVLVVHIVLVILGQYSISKVFISRISCAKQGIVFLWKIGQQNDKLIPFDVHKGIQGHKQCLGTKQRLNLSL